MKTSIFAIALSGLIAANSWAVDKTPDPLLSLQWGIQNSGQSYLNPVTDLIYPMINGKKGLDVDIVRANALYSARMQKQVVVAIIDSGVDITHPDLASKILVNAGDCDSTGKAPFHPTDDKDKNGYKGDCTGWNVSGQGDENRVDDDMGHGTHVAGIVAAAAGNGIGVQGVATNVKILPIKLTYNGDTGANYSTRLIAALKYALAMKADVINMSLGWSSASDTAELHQLVQQLAARGTVLVVAAGNNTSSRPIYPCAYEEAICVGAVHADNSITDFSNIGGQVDVLAPGANILSTIPSVLQPQNFSMNGYDFKNGTSQAAPFVAGAVAVLKSIYPSIGLDEVRARLMLSALNRPQTSVSVAGLVQIGRAIEQPAREAVYPVFKGDDNIHVNPSTLRFSWPLEVKNFWSAGSDNVQVDVIASNNMKLDQAHFDLGAFKANEVKTVNLGAVMAGQAADRNLTFQIKVTQAGRSDTYVVNRTGSIVSGDMPLEKLPIDFTAAPQFAAGHLKLVSIVDNFADNEDPEYMSVTGDAKGSSLGIFTRQGDKYIARSLPLRDGETVFKVAKVDADQDGRPDYFIQTYFKTPTEHFEVRYLDSSLKPLYDFDTMTVDGAVVINWKDVAWLPVSYKGRVMQVPVFDEPGVTTDIDVDHNPFDETDDAQQENRLYYLNPNTQTRTLQARTFLNYAMKQTLLAKLGLRFPSEVYVRFLLPQTMADVKAGRADVLLEVRSSVSLPQYAKMTLAGGVKIQTLQKYAGAFDLRGFDKVRQPGVASSDELFLSRVQPSSNVIEFARLHGLEQPRFFSYTHSPLQDTVIGPISAASDGQNVTLLVETKTKVAAVSVDASNKQTVKLNTLNHISILSNLVFSQLMAPIRVHGKLALSIDSVQLYRGDIDVLTAAQGSMAPSIQNSFQIYGVCDSLALVTGTSDSKLAFVCDDQSGKNVTRLPVR